VPFHLARFDSEIFVATTALGIKISESPVQEIMPWRQNPSEEIRKTINGKVSYGTATSGLLIDKTRRVIGWRHSMPRLPLGLVLSHSFASKTVINSAD